MKAMDRRQFLATGAAGAAALAVGSEAVAAYNPAWNSRSTRALRKFRDPLPTACAGCDSRCAMIAYRYQGKVMGLTPVDGGCARGLQMLEALFDPERLALPLQRVGARGSGKWETISWEEATAMIKAALASSGGRNVADLGRPDPAAGELLPRLGFDRLVTEQATRAWATLQAQQAVFGAPLARTDLMGAKTVLLIGALGLDQGDDLVVLSRELTALRRNGAKIILLSSYQGATGSFADQWIPVRPGGEATVALGLARLLLEGVSDASAQEIQQLLEGFDAAACVAAGVDEQALVRLAERFRGNRTVCLTDSAGREDALALESATALLNLMSGALAAGSVQTEMHPAWLPRLEATDPRERIVGELLGAGPAVGVYLDYRANPVYRSPESERVKAAFADEARVGLLVSMDTHLTETGMVADLVLPAAVDLECWNLLVGNGLVRVQQPVNAWRSATSFLRDREIMPEWLFDGPPPSPLGEAKQLSDLLFGLADAGDAGVRNYLGTLLQTRAPQVLNDLMTTGTHRLPMQGRLDQLDLKTGLSAAKPLGGAAAEGLKLTVLRRAELDPAYTNGLWGRELAHDNPLIVNAATATRLGLDKGAKATLSTPAGEVTVSVLPIQGIHPEAAVLFDDFGHWGGGVVSRNAKEASPLADIKMSRRSWAKQALLAGNPQPGFTPWWAGPGPGVSARAVTALRPETAGAQVWSGLQVTLRPV